MPDRGSIPNQRVLASVERCLDLGGRRSAQDAETRDPHRRQRKSETIADRKPRAGELVARGEHVLEPTIHRERAVNPSARKADLTRFAHHVRECPGLNHDDRAAVLCGLGTQHAAVPEAHVDREVNESTVRDLVEDAVRSRGHVRVTAARTVRSPSDRHWAAARCHRRKPGRSISEQYKPLMELPRGGVGAEASARRRRGVTRCLSRAAGAGPCSRPEISVPRAPPPGHKHVGDAYVGKVGDAKRGFGRCTHEPRPATRAPPAIHAPAGAGQPRGHAGACNPNSGALDHLRRPNACSSRYGTDSRTLESAASSSAQLSGRAHFRR